MQEFLLKLLVEPRVWMAAIGLFNAFQRWLVPGVPDYVMSAINGGVVAIAIVVTGKEVIQARLLAIKK